MRYSPTNHRRLRRSAGWIGLALSMALVAGIWFGFMASRHPSGVSAQELSKLNRFIQNSNAKDGATKVFRDGRDQIEEENWAGAAATFSLIEADSAVF